MLACILLDIRETRVMRGYHVMAAAALMTPALAKGRCYALTNGEGDAEIARLSFQFDSGVQLPIWDESRWPDLQQFDLFVTVADYWPDDPATRRAHMLADITVAGITLPGGRAPLPGLVIVDGNDTAAIAQAAIEALQPLSSSGQAT